MTGSNPHGLSLKAATQRLIEFGPNELEEKKKKPAWLLFLNQFKDFMILVLIAAAIRIVARIPKTGRSTNPATTVPKIAPARLQA